MKLALKVVWYKIYHTYGVTTIHAVLKDQKLLNPSYKKRVPLKKALSFCMRYFSWTHGIALSFPKKGVLLSYFKFTGKSIINNTDAMNNDSENIFSSLTPLQKARISMSVISFQYIIIKRYIYYEKTYVYNDFKWFY